MTESNFKKKVSNAMKRYGPIENDTGSETIGSGETCLWGGRRSPMPFGKMNKKYLVLGKNAMIVFIYDLLLIKYNVLRISKRKTSKSLPLASFFHSCGEDELFIQGIYL